MSINTTDYRVISLNTPQSFQYKKIYGLQPLQTGKQIPTFSFNQKQLITTYLPYGSLAGYESISIQDLLEFKQPIVFAFFTANHFNEKVFEEIESLKLDVEVMGGKLILIANSFLREIKRFAQNNSITIYYDPENNVAEHLGLYNYDNRLFDWVSGVESENAVLPAFYVVNADKRVVYQFADYNVTLFEKTGFSKLEFVRNLLSAVHNSHKQFQKYHWSKRVVS